MHISKKTILFVFIAVLLLSSMFLLVYSYYVHNNRPSFRINGVKVNDFAYWLNGTSTLRKK